MASVNGPYSDDEIAEASDDELEMDHVQSNGSPDQAPAATDRYGFMGGQQFTDPALESTIPPEILRKRELKWLDMLENWERWMTKRFKKVKDRCRKGIPPSIRPRAWQYLCGSKFLMEHNRGVFEHYLKQPGDPKCVDDIKKDLHRQFPLHEMFAANGGHGQEDLFRVLKAYTIHNPREGYCQAQAPVAAALLMHMPAEQAFWCLVSLCDKYLSGYYSPGLEAIQVDGNVLFGLLKKSSFQTYKHLKKQKIDPILYMTEWFMCAFARTLPWASVLRVWDMFFCEGIKVIFRIALVLFKCVLGKSDQLAECPSLYETMEKLRNIPFHYLQEEFLVVESLKVGVDERDMEKEHQRQLLKRRTKSKSDSKNKKKRKQSNSTEID